MPEPLSWEWIAAFVDAEGAISVYVRKHSIDISVSFTQKYRAVLEDISSYICSQGVGARAIYSERGGRVNRLIIGANADIIGANADIERILKGMLPFLRVKFNQAQGTLQYLRDEITGDQYGQLLNTEISAGKRSGKYLTTEQPWLRGKGILATRQASMQQARLVYQQLVKSPDRKQFVGRNAIERNFERGLRTKRKILHSVGRSPRSTMEICRLVPRSRGHLARILRGLTAAGYVTAKRGRVVEPAVYFITETGRSYVLELDEKLQADYGT